MNDVKKSIVDTMDGIDGELCEFLPYIFQDVLVIGCCPELILDLFESKKIEYTNKSDKLKILDLGCGKGTVSVRIAEKYGHEIYGIDGLNGFIQDAINYSNSLGVRELCNFKVADIRTEVDLLRNYDVAILCAVEVFRDMYNTLKRISPCVKSGGYIIIGSVYIEDHTDFTHPEIQLRSEVLSQLEESPVKIIDEILFDNIKDVQDENFKFMRKRIEELKREYPDKANIFDSYILSQEEICDVYENHTKLVVWLLQKE